jgi:membrane protein oxaA 2
MFGLVRNPLTYMKKIDTATIENYKNEIKQEVGENSISTNYPEISIVKYVNENKEKSDEAYINMNFLGLDLSSVPQENYKDFKVYIIPVLYVLTSMLSMKISTSATNKKDKNIEKEESKEVKKEQEELDMAEQMTKNMSWFMPIMAVSISIIAPLGLALYWLVNNILMIFERLILNKILDSKEEA